jgi:hypothetical protein
MRDFPHISVTGRSRPGAAAMIVMASRLQDRIRLPGKNLAADKVINAATCDKLVLNRLVGLGDWDCTN